MMISVRSEIQTDIPLIYRVHEAAFPTTSEAKLVDALRQSGKLSLSLVAEDNGAVIGHLAFSPVEVQASTGSSMGFGLAPVAVLPGSQRYGIGSLLIRTGLARCKQSAVGFVVVLGEPAYYRRFGFEPASRWFLGNEYGAGEEFMAIEFRSGAIPQSGGLVRYTPEFSLVAV